MLYASPLVDRLPNCSRSDVTSFDIRVIIDPLTRHDLIFWAVDDLSESQNSLLATLNAIIYFSLTVEIVITFGDLADPCVNELISLRPPFIHCEEKMIGAVCNQLSACVILSTSRRRSHKQESQGARTQVFNHHIPQGRLQNTRPLGRSHKPESLRADAKGPPRNYNFELVSDRSNSRRRDPHGSSDCHTNHNATGVRSVASDVPNLVSGIAPATQGAEGSRPSDNPGNLPAGSNYGEDSHLENQDACCPCVARNISETNPQGGRNGR